MPFVRGDDKYRLTLKIVETDDGGYAWEIAIADNSGSAPRQQRDISDDSYDTADEAESAGRARMTKLLKDHTS